jgi:hypothetical protein
VPAVNMTRHAIRIARYFQTSVEARPSQAYAWTLIAEELLPFPKLEPASVP